MKIMQLAAWLIVLGLAVFVLIVAESLILPFVVAVVVWFLINTLANGLQQIKIKGKSLHNRWALAASAVVIIALLVLAVQIIINSINDLVTHMDSHQENFNSFIGQIKVWFNLEELPTFSQILEDIDLQSIIGDVATGLSGFAGDLFLVIIYVIFLLIEQSTFRTKLHALFPGSAQYDHAKRTLDRISNSINTYFSVKSGLSFLTATISYLILIAVGVDLAVFWAFLIFILNFIPTFGSLVATTFPALFALFQFGGYTEALIILFSVGTVQVIIGNFIDPRLTGNTLNISTLVVLLSLGFWGLIWGVVGMILSVPIMVSLAIILAEFPETRSMAILLSEKGTLTDPDEELVSLQSKIRTRIKKGLDGHREERRKAPEADANLSDTPPHTPSE